MRDAPHRPHYTAALFESDDLLVELTPIQISDANNDARHTNLLTTGPENGSRPTGWIKRHSKLLEMAQVCPLNKSRH